MPKACLKTWHFFFILLFYLRLRVWGVTDRTPKHSVCDGLNCHYSSLQNLVTPWFPSLITVMDICIHSYSAFFDPSNICSMPIRDSTQIVFIIFRWSVVTSPAAMHSNRHQCPSNKSKDVETIRKKHILVTGHYIRVTRESIVQCTLKAYCAYRPFPFIYFFFVFFFFFFFAFFLLLFIYSHLWGWRVAIPRHVSVITAFSWNL